MTDVIKKGTLTLTRKIFNFNNINNNNINTLNNINNISNII